MSRCPIAESISTASKQLQEQTKIRRTCGYIVSDRIANFLFNKSFNMNKSIAENTYNRYRTGKFYSWYTLDRTKIDDKYIALGPKIDSAIVQTGGESKEDIIEYFSTHLATATSTYYRSKMKGGHRKNAEMNAQVRASIRSKSKRQKYRKERNAARLMIKTNSGPKGINFALRYLYDAKDADIVKAAWETVPDFSKLSQVKKLNDVINSVPVTKLSDRSEKIMCTLK